MEKLSRRTDNVDAPEGAELILITCGAYFQMHSDLHSACKCTYHMRIFLCTDTSWSVHKMTSLCTQLQNHVTIEPEPAMYARGLQEKWNQITTF